MNQTFLISFQWSHPRSACAKWIYPRDLDPIDIKNSKAFAYNKSHNFSFVCCQNTESAPRSPLGTHKKKIVITTWKRLVPRFFLKPPGNWLKKPAVAAQNIWLIDESHPPPTRENSLNKEQQKREFFFSQNEREKSGEIVRLIVKGKCLKLSFPEYLITECVWVILAQGSRDLKRHFSADKRLALVIFFCILIPLVWTPGA